MKAAIGMIELSSIARGVLATDSMIKKAPVDLLIADTVSTGKYIILISGGVAEVDEAMKAGMVSADSHLVDSLFLPQVHSDVIPGIQGKFPKSEPDSLAILETETIASTIVASDQALKAASVHLFELKLGKGIGGKGYFIVTGELSEVEAAMEAGKSVLDGRSTFLKSEIIPRPHQEIDLKGKRL